MTRAYPSRPLVGVGALIFRGGAALLVKRAKEPGRGQWSIPGGAVKVGESLSEGLAREIAEEVGLQAEIGPLVEVVERIFRDEAGQVAYHYVLLDYLCFAPSGEPKPGSDVSAAQFVPPERWAELDLPAVTLKVLQKAQALAAQALPEQDL